MPKDRIGIHGSDAETGRGDKQPKKTLCPITLEEFEKMAKPVLIEVNGQHVVAQPKAPFSTGSFGWHVNAKVTLKVGEELIPVQLNIGLTVINSKDAAR